MNMKQASLCHTRSFRLGGRRSWDMCPTAWECWKPPLQSFKQLYCETSNINSCSSGHAGRAALVVPQQLHAEPRNKALAGTRETVPTSTHKNTSIPSVTITNISWQHWFHCSDWILENFVLFRCWKQCSKKIPEQWLRRCLLCLDRQTPASCCTGFHTVKDVWRCWMGLLKTPCRIKHRKSSKREGKRWKGKERN